MNRRDFIKKASVMGALTTWTVTCQYEEKDHDPKGEEGKTGEVGYRWDYRVYCYEREQGEWVFSQNIEGSFAPEREYVTFEEEQTLPYTGWMDQGKLHFATLQEAQDFVDTHVKAKDDTNLVDSIYDIYYVDWDNLEYESCQPTEIKVAHYWFNGDTGRQIEWVADKPYTNWSKIESA
ncbi:hypothetical protein [uncultured Maribacter sp.]|uniref:hypothetical protein n=1 Tax=uncultured Maribacter sp. TaxID=431308 RepID=UPI0030DBD9A8